MPEIKDPQEELRKLLDSVSSQTREHAQDKALVYRDRLIAMADEYRDLGPEAIALLIDALVEVRDEPKQSAAALSKKLEHALGLDEPEEEGQEEVEIVEGHLARPQQVEQEDHHEE